MAEDKDLKEKLSTAEFNKIMGKFDDLMSEMSKVIVGQTEVVKQVLVSIMCDGNALLESYPGLGKTLMIKTLAQTLDLKFTRIQSTPDLMPSDITGTYIIEEKSGKKEFKFREGPLFSNIVLVDEINRATPKTQAALLEAMQEKQVTSGNETFQLDKPFFVLATQNPIDFEGSLALDQSVFVNGGIKTGSELLAAAEKAKSVNIDGKGLYDIGAYTYALNENGVLQKSSCLLYTLPYKDEIVNLRTQTGREIKVTKNHPFLVAENGIAKWKKAEDLTINDFIISPAKLPELVNEKEKMSHEDAVNKLKEKFCVITTTDIKDLDEKSEKFTDFSAFTGTDFNKLRISCELDKKELSKRLGLDRRGYWNMVRFLSRNTRNDEIKSSLAGFFTANTPEIDEKAAYVESYRITKIRNFDVDEDIAACLAFLLSDGSITENYVAAYQKNYPEALENFTRTMENKIGTRISEIRDATTGRTVMIRSKPLVEYLKLRFNIDDPSWMISLPSDLRKSFLKTFISLESHLDAKRKRITFTQKDRKMTNIISYMLLAEGITSWTRWDKHVYRVKIQGEDFFKYLYNIGWIENAYNVINHVDTVSTHRLVPVNKKLLMHLCKLLGIASFHTFKERKDITSRSWYPAYRKVKEGRQYMSSFSFKNMIHDLKEEIQLRKNTDVSTLTRENPRKVAVLCGLGMEEIVENTDFTKHVIWQSYAGQQQCTQLCSYLQQQYMSRINIAETILNYLESMETGYVLYEKIKSMSYEDYEGLVFGLTVPGLQNYIAGFGGCGINHNTYPLPEAQIDRFLLKILLTYPTFKEESEILERYTKVLSAAKVKKAITKDELLRIQSIVRMVPISTETKDYILNIVTKTRDHKYIEFGASPRATIALTLAAKAYALINKRNYVSKKDVKEIAYPVLRHRIILNFKAEKDGKKPDDIVTELVG